MVSPVEVGTNNISASSSLSPLESSSFSSFYPIESMFSFSVTSIIGVELFVDAVRSIGVESMDGVDAESMDVSEYNDGEEEVDEVEVEEDMVAFFFGWKKLCSEPLFFLF